MKSKLFILWILLSLCGLYAQETPGALTIGPFIQSPRAEFGGQLIYYFDLIRNDTGYMTIVNNGPHGVSLHMQLLGSDCYEMFNFSIRIESRCSKRYDLRNFVLNGKGATTDLLGMKGLIFVTPTQSGSITSQAAIAFNHLSGSIVLADSRKGNSYSFLPVCRKAISFLGEPLGPPWTTETLLDGTTALFEVILPKKLSIDNFFALSTISDSRLVLISFLDSYGGSYSVVPAEDGHMTMFAGMEDCGLFSLPTLAYACFTDLPLSQILGATATYFQHHAGRLDMTPVWDQEAILVRQNLFGFQFETLGPYTAAHPIWAEAYPFGMPIQITGTSGIRGVAGKENH